MGQRFRSGVFIGTAAIVKIESEKVGFKPQMVKLYNVTDGSFAFWAEHMTVDRMVLQKAGATTYEAADGITPLAGGFQLGAHAFNAASDEIHYECWG